MPLAARKTTLKAELVALMRRDLEAAERAHRGTVAAATHEEAKPENDKDTRALEQSYLARGQAQRVEELRGGVALVEAMAVGGTPLPRAALGALVTVVAGAEEAAEAAVTYWIAADGGGARLEGGAVQVVTPRSPLGRALVGKAPGDECEAVIAGRTRRLEVVTVDGEG